MFPPCPGNGSGIGVNGLNSSNLTVRNGTVRDMPANENVRTGISSGAGAIVSENIVYKNGVDGISALTGSLVSDNLASENVDIGIRVSS
jgi:hypothetical protein